ncbi:hypothetical protein GCM10022217_26310 [Chryseobacterium ginsenosidimutans]|uniref:restriction endonuclease n=1 Tax=Chryseobacterium ginsenosidimutans TaxID=687846 RepID=UPI0031D8D8BB
MEQRNTLNWKTYESITKYIYETLRKEFNVSIEGYGYACKVKGKSNIYHQIDVLTSESDGTRSYRTAIECKYWNKRINKDTVMKLWAIIFDSDIEEGIIVSKKGFTKDTQQFADHYNIKLVQLRETGGEDKDIQKELEIGILDLKINSILRRPQILKIVANTIDGRLIALSEREQFQIFIEDGRGGKNSLFKSIMIFKKDLHNGKPYFVIGKAYNFIGSTLYYHNNKEYISSIDFNGILTVKNENNDRKYTIVDQIWLIMKSIFEKRTFTISKFGYISEHKGLDKGL